MDERRALADAAQQALLVAAQEEARCKELHEAAEAALDDSRADVDELRHERDRYAEQCGNHAQAVLDAYKELPESYRRRVSAAMPGDWIATVFPKAADLAQLDRELAGANSDLAELRKAGLERQQAHATLRREHQHAERDLAALQEQLGELDRNLIQQTERVKLGRAQLEPALADLPARWRYRAADVDDAQIEALAAEHARLTKQDVAGRLDELHAAQAAEEPLRRQLGQLDAELEQVPAAARRDPTEFEPALRAAKQRETALRQVLSDGQAEQRQLHEQRQRREQLSAEFLAADRRRHLSARLAELLSRRHLQRHLLRQAEAGIVENTNRVLDRITAGQLCVRLLPEEDNDDNRALQLEAYKPAVMQSFGLSFLSGSERFRVAIGLALGIGQYASRQHRAIESVIIDEGFGCLDRDNRRTMIDELDHLRGQLRCILLVSHQEEFADAFPDGYRFRLTDGMTRVERAE